MKKHSNNKSNIRKVVTVGAITTILAGGLGFQTYQVHQLGEDLLKVKKNYLQTVQNLNETTDKYNNLLLLNQKVEKQVEDLKWEINTLTESNTSLQEQVKENKATIDNKNNEINRLRSQIKSQNAASISRAASNNQSNVKATYNMTASAYTTASNGDPHTSGKWGDLTASGTTVKEGRTIAVDKNLIPLGTKVKLTFPEGWEHLNGVYISEDTGNYIRGKRIDIYFDSYQTCVNFGKRTVKLEVLA